MYEYECENWIWLSWPKCDLSFYNKRANSQDLPDVLGFHFFQMEEDGGFQVFILHIKKEGAS